MVWEGDCRPRPSSSLLPHTARLNSQPDGPSSSFPVPQGALSGSIQCSQHVSTVGILRTQPRRHCWPPPRHRADKSPEVVPLTNGREPQTSGTARSPQISSVLRISATGGAIQLPADMALITRALQTFYHQNVNIESCDGDAQRGCTLKGATALHV